MNIDGPLLDIDTVPPDQIEKLRAAQDPPGTFHQSGQQPSFLGSDRYGVTTACDFHGRPVEFQIVKFQHLVGRGRMRSPEKRANAADQLAWGKRLRDIVVGPDVEAERAVSFLAAGAELAISSSPPRARDCWNRQIKGGKQRTFRLNQRVTSFGVGCGVKVVSGLKRG